jgi:hypothetical protein
VKVWYILKMLIGTGYRNGGWIDLYLYGDKQVTFVKWQ